MSSTATELPGLVPGTWTIDPTHTEVGFSVRHLMVSKVRGRFSKVDGEINIAENLQESSARATIEMASVDTRAEDRDNHLRSPDFFDVENHPTMTYASTGIRRNGEDYEVDGELTIRGVTRPVTLTVEWGGVHPDPWGGQRLGLSATGRINRQDFGMDFNIPIEGGGVVVGDRIDLTVDAEAVLQR
ncbi:MAG: hypothetical protein GEV03_17850 [Streptosporangiales bacterium]|nr:hypothetical protein [Streptosporangiales bacterium]